MRSLSLVMDMVIFQKIQIFFSFVLVSIISSKRKLHELHIMLTNYSIDQLYISVLNLLDILFTVYYRKI